MKPVKFNDANTQTGGDKSRKEQFSSVLVKEHHNKTGTSSKQSRELKIDGSLAQ